MAADVELSVDSAIETVLNKLVGIFSQKDDCAKRLHLKIWLRRKMYFLAQGCVTRFVAVIGCRPIQLRQETFWSAPVGDAPWKWKMDRGSKLITVCTSSCDSRLYSRSMRLRIAWCN